MGLDFKALLLLFELAVVQCGNILFIPPMMSPSHKIVLLPWADALALRGHNVLVWEPGVKLNPYRTSVAKMDHFQVKLDFPFYNDLVVYENSSLTQRKVWRQNWNAPYDEPMGCFLATSFCKELLEKQPERVEELLQTNWELVIVDELFNPCGYFLAALLREKLDTKLALYVSNLRMMTTTAAYNLIPTPPSYVPYFGAIQGYSDRMTFLQRANSAFLNTLRYFITDTVHWSIQLRLRQFFPFRLDIRDGIHSPDFLFTAYIPELDFPHPTFANVANLGGIHIPPPTDSPELPAPLAQLIHSYPRGFVLVALGHWVKWDFAPPYIKQAFVDGLKMLPQDILVLFAAKGNAFKDGIAPNVKIFDWLPQRQLLRYPKLLVFLTHGGCNSITEATFQGVPMVVFPLFADQPDGAVRVEARRHGLRLRRQDLTPEKLHQTLLAVITDKRFGVQARRFAVSLGDLPDRAKRMAIFWSEFLLRHGSRRRRRGFHGYGWHLSFVYHSLDLISCLLLTIFCTLYCFF